MTRDELARWMAGHREAADEQRSLEVGEAADPRAAVARSLSLIAAIRATIPSAEIDAQRQADDEQVREIWNRLRRMLRA